MRIVRALAVACAALLLAGGQARGDAKTDAEKALLGKWQAKEKAGDQEVTAEIEFRKGGVVTTKALAGGKEVGGGEGTYKVLDAKTLEVTFVPFPDTFTNQPYHAIPDSDHNVWAPLWTTDQIAKYDPTANTWTMYDLPTRGTEIRIASILERNGSRQIVFAYPRTSKIAAMSFRSEADIAALKREARR